MGHKGPDFMVAFGCSACHDALDGRTVPAWAKGMNNLEPYLREAFSRGHERTLAQLFDAGVIGVK